MTLQYVVSHEKELNNVGLLLARIGLALVFLYFGVSQLLNPAQFVGWLPAEASIVPLQPTTLIILNGGVEVLFGVLLLLGLFTRVSALILGLHLFAITLSIGYTEIGVRDFGLSIATLAFALFQNSSFSFDAFATRAKSIVR